jgi:Dynein heavy chain, N-terminal region 2
MWPIPAETRRREFGKGNPPRGRIALKGADIGIQMLVLQLNLWLALSKCTSKVMAMISEEGERVQLQKSFNPKSANGVVERWLTTCEAAMRDTVRRR